MQGTDLDTHFHVCYSCPVILFSKTLEKAKYVCTGELKKRTSQSLKRTQEADTHIWISIHCATRMFKTDNLQSTRDLTPLPSVAT